MADEAELSVVFSFRNEEEVLPRLVERTVRVLEQENLNYELIFVNDASTDRSLEVLLAAREKNPRIRIVNLSRRFGVSEGVLAGLNYARGQAIVYLDCDLQDPPEVIPQLVARWRDGANIVHAVRARRRGEQPLKIALTRLGYWVINLGAEIPLRTEAGDFKLLSRRAAGELLQLGETDPYMRGLVSWVGFRADHVLYEREPRAAGHSKFPLWSRGPWKMFAMGLTSHSFLPIYLVLGAGMVGLAVSVLLLCLWAAGRVGGFAVALMTAWATIMVALGIIGVYVVRIYKDVRGRPRHIVDSVIG